MRITTGTDFKQFSDCDLVVEAAHFSAEGTAKMSRRHKLHSEASYRFERGVDPAFLEDGLAILGVTRYYGYAEGFPVGTGRTRV